MKRLLPEADEIGAHSVVDYPLLRDIAQVPRMGIRAFFSSLEGVRLFSVAGIDYCSWPQVTTQLRALFPALKNIFSKHFASIDLEEADAGG